MRFTFFLFLAFVSSLTMPLCAADIEEEGYTFTVREARWRFSTDYIFTLKGAYFGKVNRGHFGIRTHYDLYGSKQQYEGTGICRLVNLGLFFAWATEIDIYDDKNESIGFIDGQIATFQAARFSIYDHGELVGIAFLDRNCSGFNIVDAETECIILATLTRHFIRNAVDYWTIHVIDPVRISPEIIKVFSAFVVDSQASFLEDL